MTIHEFGAGHSQIVVLIHPSLVRWDYFEAVIPLLEKRYHLVVPALPGYDVNAPGDFTSVEAIAAALADWLIGRGHREIACVYGCSMGGAIVARFLADDRVAVGSAVMDGGITPYRLPWIVTRFIALRDFLMIYMGKLGGVKLLEQAFSTDDYSKEDLKYVVGVMNSISARTIWRTFDSCNNYQMPERVHLNGARVEYWVAEAERKDRKWDIENIKATFPEAVFKVFDDIGHGGLAVLKPKRFAAELERVMTK